MSENVLEQIKILENVDLRSFNTFHVSAHARYFVDATEIGHLRQALAFSRERALPFMLIGQGSNLLFREDYPGLVIELNIKGRKLLRETGSHAEIAAMCGENWHDFVQYCIGRGWYGLENLSLIPGTVGAAPVQNIGAYGVEIAETLLDLEALEIDSGKLVTFSKADCEFAYRSSVFKERLQGRYVICRVRFRLHKEPRVNIAYASLRKALAHLPRESLTPELVGETVCAIRRSKLPDPVTVGNAGSFFWNPVLDKAQFEQLQARFPDIVGYPEHGRVKVPAAWLIEKAGWKGHREGDVGVHREHALVLVNHGRATGAQLYELSRKIQASVKAMFGVELTPEVRII